MNNKKYIAASSELYRVHKLLSRLGIASRREAEEWVRLGRVRINGELCTLGRICDPTKDRITIDHQLVCCDAYKISHPVFMLYKPKKVLVSRRSQGKKRTIYDLPYVQQLCNDGGENTQRQKQTKFLPAVGRLDYQSEGLLLLTCDGDFAHQLMHPRFLIAKTYEVAIDTALTASQISEIENFGIQLDDGWVRDVICQPIKYSKTSFWMQAFSKQQNAWWYRITLCEGRNRIVRRIFAYYQRNVLALIRIQIGGLHLPKTLKPGLGIQLNDMQREALFTDSRK